MSLHFLVGKLDGGKVDVIVLVKHEEVASVVCDPTLPSLAAALSAASDFRTAFIGASSGGG